MMTMGIYHSGHQGRADAPDFAAMDWAAMSPEARAAETARFQHQQKVAMDAIHAAEAERAESRRQALPLIAPVLAGLAQAGIGVPAAELREAARMGGTILTSMRQPDWQWGIACVASATWRNPTSREVTEIGITETEIIVALDAGSRRYRKILRAPRSAA